MSRICVDNLMHHGWSKGPSCHLFHLDNDMEALDAFALSIGCKRGWRHGDHYDLVESKRARAVEEGARELNPRLDPEWRTWAKSRSRVV